MLFRSSLAVIGLLAGLSAATARPPEPDAPEPGRFVTVATPITSPVVNQIKEAVARAMKDRPLKKIVFDFNPEGREAATDDFGVCLDLARHIRSLGNEGVLTVAYVRNRVSRHTVLPVLACAELVMGPDGVLGPVAASATASPDPFEASAYEKIARPDQAALILKLLDPAATILEGRKNGVWYVDARKEAEAAAAGVTFADRTPVLRAGAAASFRPADAQKFQLCKAVIASRQQVEQRYNMPAGSHREDILMDRARVAMQINVRGELNSGLEASLRRQLDRAARQGVNLIFLQLDCGGGKYDSARDLGEFIRNLRGPDGRPVMTVAFIPRDAPDTATFLALGCREIVMAQPARLGDFTGFLNPPRPKRGPAPPPPDITPVRDSLVALAEAQGYPVNLVRGLFEPNLEVVRAKRIASAVTERRFLTAEEAREKDDQGRPVWQIEDTVKHAGKPLIINGANAASLGFARHVVAQPDDLAELYRFYGLETKDVRSGMPDFLDRFASFLADPFVAVFLVLIGISCLLIELKLPGISLPGVVAAICFVLFFWSQSQLNGQITPLAVALFLLGILMLGMEIFVLPGFGVLGISGIGLILFGLALATVERMPATSQEWGILGGAILKFALTLIGSMLVAVLAARFLPSIPVANRLVLHSPDDPDNPPDADQLAAAAEHLALLGAIGTASTMLRPAGMAQFGERFLDVVSDGGFIPAGAQVRVIEIEGNRIVVKEV
jgi:membrane-bound ClpP family serine protease